MSWRVCPHIGAFAEAKLQANGVVVFILVWGLGAFCRLDVTNDEIE